MALVPIVEIEDEIYSYTPADNGASPLWCHGSTVVTRRGQDVFVTGLETLPDRQPLNNCRWTLYRRDNNGWQQVYRDDSGLTREPSPLVLIGDELLVSANPTLTAVDTYSGPAAPCVWRFDSADLNTKPSRQSPQWQGSPTFSEHSYRTFCADSANGEALYMQNVGYDAAHLSFLGRDGHWRGLGALKWPWGGEYPQPQPLRLCYPNVFMREGAAHFLGVGDIVEPVAAWKQEKHRRSGRDWDYVFRRLFYAYTPDLVSQPFGDWIEIANLDATAGQTRNGDIHVETDGTAHLLWCETSTDTRLRDRFFPDETVIQRLKYLRLRHGKKIQERTLADLHEGQDGLRPDLARFHILPDGTLLVLAAFSATEPSDNPRIYRLAVVGDEAPEWIDIPFGRPLPGTFLTNTVRGGSAPSVHIDLVGMDPLKPHTFSYARVRIRS